METAVLNLKGKETGRTELPAWFFGKKPDPHFLHEVVTAYLSNRRSGTASTKTRGEVSGGGKKPWKEKGTGRARAGSTRSPIWRKGGIVFGPRPRSYRKWISAAKRKQALAQALSAKFSEGGIKVVETLNLPEPKTRVLMDVLRCLELKAQKVLVVSEGMNENLQRAASNIQGFSHCLPADLNAYTILRHNTLIFTKTALDALTRAGRENE